MKAYKNISSRKTPQTQPILGQEDRQVANNAGGFVYSLDSFKQMERFLMLGSEGGTYYVGEQKLTRQSATNTIACIKQDGVRAVDMIVDISDSGRAPKNDPAIFALALAASTDDKETRAYALSKLPKVCRIPTHLFHFLTYVQEHRGWGRGLKKAVASWYNDQEVSHLAYEVVKYQQRDGFSNRDALRLAHPKTADPTRNVLYKYIVDGTGDSGANLSELPEIVRGFETAKGTTNTRELVSLIRQHNLSREMLPTEALTKKEVWEALLEKMPLTAMIRNLGNMSKVGLLTPMSDASRKVVEKVTNQEALQKARVHPMAILIALKTYASGRGLRGSGTWTTVQAVTDALDEAFYLAFKNLVPTGKRILFGLDVSGSMGSPCGGLPITCAEGAAAMALAIAKVEKDYHIMGFTAGPSGNGYGGGRANFAGFVDMGISPRMRLDDVLRKTRGVNFGSTDCSLPMLWAERNNARVDAFIVITDNETYAGSVHPSQALKSYRQSSGIEAKEIVIGMTPTNFSIADPKDPLTLDVVGFDAGVPDVVSNFIRG